MLIDWFTVTAQAINFLILVWLMKRYLYQPILKALDAREKLIMAELADAESRQAAAGAERDEYKRRNDEFDRQHAALLSKATGEAMAERQRLLEAARKDAASLRIKQQESLHGEYQHLHEEISRKTQSEVFAIARKALVDLAGAQLEERMVEVFLRRLRELSSEERAQMVSDQPALVRSAFDLPPEQRSTVASAIRECLAADIQIRFETSPDRISGIELVSNGYKLAWSISEYLAAMEKDVNELLKVQRKPE